MARATHGSGRPSCGSVLVIMVLASTGFQLYGAFIGGVQRRVLQPHVARPSVPQQDDKHEVHHSDPVQTPEVNYFTNQDILGCLSEGCSVERLEVLDGKLSRDARRMQEAIDNLQYVQQSSPQAAIAEVLQQLHSSVENIGNMRKKLGVALQESSVVVEKASELDMGSVPTLQMPEVNYFTNLAIAECLAEGCSIEKLAELEGRLSRDEKHIKESVQKLQAVQRMLPSAEMAETLGWFENCLRNSHTIREQLRGAKGIGNLQFAKTLVKQFVQSGVASQDGNDRFADHPAEHTAA